MSISGTTQTAVLESVTGYDEIAVENHFGIVDLYDAENIPGMKLVRAVIFVHHRHQGMTNEAALDSALSISVTKIGDFFDDEPDEVIPDEPETPEGKEHSPSAGAPTSSPSSVSPPA